MKANKLYNKLEKDFIIPGMSDEWQEYMGSVEDFLSENFKERSMGLVCDFAKNINKVYTAVFPSKNVMQKILDSGVSDAMLFVHHPAVWDITKAPEIFQQMDRNLLQKFKDRRISIYNLHVPLDNYWKYSTSKTLADALKIKPKEPFYSYFGGYAGVFGKTNIESVKELKKRFNEVIGHKVSLYNYGDDKIKNKKVAIVAGGGNDLDVLEEITRKGVNTFITGITAKNDHSKKAHDFAKKIKLIFLEEHIIQLKNLLVFL